MSSNKSQNEASTPQTKPTNTSSSTTSHDNANPSSTTDLKANSFFVNDSGNQIAILNRSQTANPSNFRSARQATTKETGKEEKKTMSITTSSLRKISSKKHTLPPLHQAAKQGSLDKVKQILESNPELINSK